MYMISINWEVMPKVKKKSDKQRQRLDKVRKRDERATNESEVSKTKKCVEKSNIPNKTEVHISNNNRDGTSCLSNGGESSSRNCAAVDSSNVPSEAQAIVDKYLQSQRDLADRAKKKYSDSHHVQGAASDMCNEKSVKEMRQQYNTEWKRRARSLAEFRKYEQQSNRVKMQMARKDLTYRDTERECNKKRNQMARKDTAYRDIEKERDKKRKTVARKDTLYRDNERQCNKKRMEIARKDTLYGDNERQCNRKSMQLARKDSGYRDKERQCNKKSMQIARKNPVQRNIERACNKKSMQMARKGPAYRKNERECNKIRMNMARINPEYRQNEQQCDTNRKKSMRNKQISLDDLIKNFHKEVEKGPVHKCCICDQLWYRHSVVILQSSSLPECPAFDACVSDIKQSEGKKLICNTCLSHLKKKKIPPSSTANGMGFPEIPQHLKDLHQVEWRLVSPRIPFMKVFAAPRGGQKKIRGNVVNVPCDTVNTFQVLPHSGNEHQTIQVKIKRDLKYTNHVMSQNVRPYKVREAAEYLVNHGKLFKDQGIAFDRNWDANNDELNNDGETNGESLLLSNTDDPEPYIDRVNDIRDEPQPGCSHWIDTVKEGGE